MPKLKISFGNNTQTWYLQEIIFSSGRTTLPHQLSLAVTTGPKIYDKNEGDSAKHITIEDDEKADMRRRKNKCNYDDPCNDSERKIFAASITYKDHDLLKAIGKKNIR